MIQSLFHLSILWLAGFLLVTLLWPGRFVKDFLIKLVLAIGLGPGIDACLYFLVTIVTGPDIQILRWVELLLILLLTSLVIYRFFPFRRGQLRLPARPALREWLPLGLFSALLLAFVAGFFFYSQTRPSGTFDAYAIWNLKARIMYRDPLHWTQVMDPGFDWKTHPDYPLLVPFNVLRLWQLLGSESTRAPVTLAAGYTFGIVGLIFAFLHRQRGIVQAAIGGFLMLATPSLLFMGTAQTADLPLAYYLLAAGMLFYLSLQEGETGTIILAGLMTGLAAWTKNDGMIFLVLFALLGLAVWIKQPRRLVWLAIGLALPLSTTLIFKLFFAPPGDMINAQLLSGLLSKITDINRYSTILVSLGKNILLIGRIQLPLLVLLSIGALYLQRKNKALEKHAYRLTWLLVGLTLLGYCGVYLLTPHPLEWHLNYSMDRLVMQVFPLVLTLLVLAFRFPQNSISAPTRSDADQVIK